MGLDTEETACGGRTVDEPADIRRAGRRRPKQRCHAHGRTWAYRGSTDTPPFSPHGPPPAAACGSPTYSTQPQAAAERRYERLDWDTLCAHTTHLILFSLEVTANGRVSALDRLPSRAELEAARVAAQKHGTKLLLCFGGNGRSDGFAAMVKSKETRRSFLMDVAKLLELNGLHGVDYNWEYPHGKQQWEGLAA